MYALLRQIWRDFRVGLFWGTLLLLVHDHIYLRYLGPKYICQSPTGELFNSTLIHTTIFPILWPVNTTYLRNTRIGGSHRANAPSYFALRECPNAQNGHIRLPNPFYNISMTTPSERSDERGRFWNPTIVALPAWAKSQYIIVSMVTAEGQAGRKTVLCEANICRPASSTLGHPREKHCTDEDVEVLGSNGGLRCVTTPIEVDLPFTPAKHCEGQEQHLADIRGFHDPRIFYTSKGEPLMFVSSQSQFACVGLWVIDLRIVYPDIKRTFLSSPKRPNFGPLVSFISLTELTRNPHYKRHSYEKNWVMFTTDSGASYLQYELTPSERTIAQFIKGGITTGNLTDRFEEPCLFDPTPDSESGHFLATGSWHQATPALKLILCSRDDSNCMAQSPDVVFFAAVHQKYLNEYGLPLRYDRYFVVWSASSPFNMLGVSQHPILMANETSQYWASDSHSEEHDWRDHFTYTTTIAWAWGREEGDVREKGTGYLDDDVIISVGVDDQDGVYGIAKASDLLQCLRTCPGRL